VGLIHRPATGPPHQLQQHSVTCPYAVAAVLLPSLAATFSTIPLLPEITV